MTAEAHHEHPYDDLHRLVDRLKPAQADAVRAVMLQLVADTDRQVDQGDDWPPAWFGSITAEQLDIAEPPNIAERSREIMRSEFGRS